MTNKTKLTRLLLLLMTYLILKFFGGSLGSIVLYPITLLVTFLHEMGHALGAILTGGAVEGMQINADGSGYTITTGGNRGIILMGGYLGSAILGNLLLYIGLQKPQWASRTTFVIIALMLVAGLGWFQSMQSTVLLLVFAASLYVLTRYTEWDAFVIAFLGLAVVLYILQDFRVGPGSDLAMYEQTVGIFNSQVWMYVWLLIAAGFTFLTVRKMNLLR